LFLGVEPGMSVLDLNAATGWYTEILARLSKLDQPPVLAREAIRTLGPMRHPSAEHTLMTRLREFETTALRQAPSAAGGVNPILELLDNLCAALVVQRTGRCMNEVVRHALREEPALAVTDQHRMETVVLVLPTDETGELLGAKVRTVRPLAITGIADFRLGITHPRQKPAEGNHHQVHREHAAMQQDDARRRAFRKDLAHVAIADVLGVEREQPLLQRAIRHDGAARRGRTRGGVVKRLRCAADERERDGREKCCKPAMNRVHESPWMRWIMSSRILATASAVNAVVRYDTPAHSVSPDVVTAITSGDAGPVGTPRT